MTEAQRLTTVERRCSFTDQVPAVQFFNIGCDMATPFRVYGSIQDHGSYRGEGALDGDVTRSPPSNFGASARRKVRATMIRPIRRPPLCGRILRQHLPPGNGDGITRRTSSPAPRITSNLYAANGWHPFFLSPHNPRILPRHFRSAPGIAGDKFEKISPDLTYNNRVKSVTFLTRPSRRSRNHRSNSGWSMSARTTARCTSHGMEARTGEEIIYGIAPHRWILLPSWRHSMTRAPCSWLKMANDTMISAPTCGNRPTVERTG